MFAVHSSNPTAPGQWECAVGITRSLEAGGRGHPSLLGQAVAWRQFPIPGYSPGKIITLPKFGLFTALFWKTCSLSFWKAWPHAVSTGSAPFPWQKQKYSPVPEQTENDQQCCLRFMKKNRGNTELKGRLSGLLLSSSSVGLGLPGCAETLQKTSTMSKFHLQMQIRLEQGEQDPCASLLSLERSWIEVFTGI